MADAIAGCGLYSYLRKLTWNNAQSKNKIMKELKGLIQSKSKPTDKFSFPLLSSGSEEEADDDLSTERADDDVICIDSADDEPAIPSMPSLDLHSNTTAAKHADQI